MREYKVVIDYRIEGRVGPIPLSIISEGYLYSLSYDTDDFYSRTLMDFNFSVDKRGKYQLLDKKVVFCVEEPSYYR